MGLTPSCGQSGSDDCCAPAKLITGDTFYRSYDFAADGMFSNQGFPATISNFYFDKYEVTVGRFREFVREGYGVKNRGPSPNAGEHPNYPGSGWDVTWNASLADDTATLMSALRCDAAKQTWTDAPDANESLPINCVTWYEAFAFCIWDGGYLPTEAEWNYAAAGGTNQRAFPWSSPADSLLVNCSYANFSSDCVNAPSGGLNRVGSEPMGDGRWEQSDLAGNVDELVLDWFSSYAASCNNCANLTPATYRTARGGSYASGATMVRTGFRDYVSASFRSPTHGVRCARKGS